MLQEVPFANEQSGSSRVCAAQDAKATQDRISWLKVQKQLDKKYRAMSSALKLPETVPNASSIEAMRVLPVSSMHDPGLTMSSCHVGSIDGMGDMRMCMADFVGGLIR